MRAPRRSVGATLFVVLVTTLLTGAPGSATADTRPNVVVFVTDDQPAVAMETMPAVRSWFQDTGTWFPKGLVTTPLCCPSRSSIFSGRYAHNHGVTQNESVEAATSLDQTKTIQYALHQAGYRTGIAGKYLNSWPLDQPPPSFDRWAIHNSSTSYWNPTMNVDGTVQQVAGFEPDLLRAQALSFLDDFEQTDDTPFYLYVATLAPHKPYSVAPRFQGTPVSSWDGDPAVFEGDRTDKPPIVRKQNATLADGVSVRERQLRSLMAADDLVNRVMTRLAELGEDDTIAIFLSDNGVMWAQHGVVAQKRLPYTPSVGVPFGMRWPGHVAEGVLDERLIANVDIAPTVAQAAGVTLDWDTDGMSLFSGESRSRILLEYFRSADAPTYPPWASTLTPRWQYTEWYGSDGVTVNFREYYNLVADPWQNDNLLKDANPANDPDVGALSAQLADERACEGASCLALAVPDLAPPGPPSNATGGLDGSGHVVVAWDAATDDVEVTGYEISRDGAPLVEIPAVTRYVDPTPVPGATHTYDIVAIDGVGNRSDTATTPPIDVPPADTVFADGFESGGLTAWSVRKNAAVGPGGRTGRTEARLVSTGQATYVRKTLPASATDVLVRADVKLESRGSNAVVLLRGMNANASGIVQAILRVDGTLAYRVDETMTLRTSSVPLPVGEWHTLALHVLVSGSTTTVELLLDGAVVVGNVEPARVSAIARVQVGDANSGRAFDLRVDDVQVREPSS
jgi:arylsulfatase A-like enzyme